MTTLSRDEYLADQRIALRDAATAERRTWLRALQQTDPLERKRRAAIAWLGSRWLLHPANAPRRRARPLSDAELRLMQVRP